MNQTNIRQRTAAALSAAAGLAVTASIAAAPAARADNTRQLPSAVSSQIAAAGPHTEISNGREAVTGPAASIDNTRAQAGESGIGTRTSFTGDHESGRATLIFTGNPDTTNTGFRVTGGDIRSVADDNDESWYIFDDAGNPDAVVSPGTARDVPPADALPANDSQEPTAPPAALSF